MACKQLAPYPTRVGYVNCERNPARGDGTRKTRLLPEEERMNQALIGQLRDLTRKMKVNMTSFEGRQMFYTLVIVNPLASIATQSQWERALAG